MTWWPLLVIFVLLGGMAGGFFVGRSNSDPSKKTAELDQKLRDTREELDHYRTQVVDHFKTTADLVNRMTADYRAVYEHLAGGAQQLAAGQTPRLEAIAPLSDHPSEPPAGGYGEGYFEEKTGGDGDVSAAIKPSAKEDKKAGDAEAAKFQSTGVNASKVDGWFEDAGPGTEIPEYAKKEEVFRPESRAS